MALKHSEAVAITSFIKLQNKSALFIPTFNLYNSKAQIIDIFERLKQY